MRPIDLLVEDFVPFGCIGLTFGGFTTPLWVEDEEEAQEDEEEDAVLII
jgi:hypothetical protein